MEQNEELELGERRNGKRQGEKKKNEKKQKRKTRVKRGGKEEKEVESTGNRTNIGKERRAQWMRSRCRETEKSSKRMGRIRLCKQR